MYLLRGYSRVFRYRRVLVNNADRSAEHEDIDMIYVDREIYLVVTH